MESVGLHSRARTQASNFHFLAGRFTYRLSGKWPVPPRFHEGLVRAPNHSPLPPSMKSCCSGSTHQHQILIESLYDFFCVLLLFIFFSKLSVWLCVFCLGLQMKLSRSFLCSHLTYFNSNFYDEVRK